MSWLFDGIEDDGAFKTICVLAAMGVVFGVWKLVDGIVWLCHHVSITVK